MSGRETNGYVARTRIKKTAKEEGAIIVYGDEASFQQSPTFHQTWAPVNVQPKVLSKRQRNSQKIFGGIELYSGKFLCKHKEENFHAETYIEFLKNCRNTITKEGIASI